MFRKLSITLFSVGLMVSVSFAASSPIPTPSAVPCATDFENLLQAVNATMQSEDRLFEAQSQFDEDRNQLATLQKEFQANPYDVQISAEINNLTQEITVLQSEIPGLQQANNANHAAWDSAKVAYQTCMDFLPTLP